VIALDLLTSSSSSSSSAAGGSDVSVAVRAALPSLGVRFSTVWVDSFAQAVEMSLWVVEAPVAAASDELRGGSAQDKRAAAAASAAGTGTPAGVSSASTAGTVSSSSSSSSAAASSQRDDSSPLVYGEMLSLRHRATGLYLCVQTSSAGVTIKPRADAGSWTMQSASRHRVRGSAVSHGDALVLLAFPSLMKLNAQEASEASIGFQNHIFRVRKLADAPPANALQFYNIVRLSWRSHADLVLTPQSVVKRSLVSAVIGEASPQSSSSVASMWIVEPLGALAAGADGASAMSGASSDANVSGGVGRTANGAGAVHWGSEALLRSMIDGKYLAVFPTRSAAAGVPDGASGAAGTAAGADTSGIVRSRVRTGTLDRRPGARRASDAAAGAATGGAAAAAAQPRPPLGVFGVPLPQGHVWTAADAKPWNTAANAGSAGGSAYDRLQELCLEDELRVGHTLVPGDLGEGDFHVLAVFHPELWRTNRDDLLPLLPQAPLFDGLTAADIQDRIRGEHLVWKLESCRRESTYVLQVPVSLHDPFFLRHKSTDTVLRLVRCASARSSRCWRTGVHVRRREPRRAPSRLPATACS
jgi:hypothetical protein